MHKIEKLIIAAMIVLLTTSAFAQFNGCGPGFCNGGGSGTPAATGDILLVDGTSFILQTDASSFICLAGGC